MRGGVLVAAMVASLACAARATTLVMLVSEQAAVIASDSFAHGNQGTRVSTARRKVSRAGHVLIGTAGVAALADSGGMKVDLHDLVVRAAAARTWREPREDAAALAATVHAELQRMQAVLFPGHPSRDVNPTVSVFVAGRSRRRMFAVRVTIPGALSPAIGGHRLLFGPARVQEVPIRKDTATIELVSRLPEVADAAMEEVRLTRTPALAALIDPKVALSARTLEAAARDLVNYTIAADPQIGGAVQVERL